jgi:nitrogen fixation protein FixH
MTTNAQKPRSAKLWPMLVVLMLVSHVTLMMVAVRYATGGSRGEHAIVPDYYDKALAWDTTRAAQAESDKLGWKATLSTTPGARPEERILSLTLVDANGQPVEVTDAAVSYFHLSQGQDVKRLPLLSVAPGKYQGTMSIYHPGFHQFDLLCTRGDATFVLNVMNYVE